MGDDPTVLFKTTSDVDSTPVGIRLPEAGGPQPSPSVGIILEDRVVMEVADLPHAFCLLFGLIYALHLDYPAGVKPTFIFIQQVMLNLGKGDPKGKVLSLKNQLEEE